MSTPRTLAARALRFVIDAAVRAWRFVFGVKP